MTGPEFGSVTSIGVDIGGTKVLGVALDAQGTVVSEARVPTPAAAGGRSDAQAVVDAVGAVVEQLRQVTPTTVAGCPVGIGVPGMLDRAGILRFAPNLPAAAGAPMGDLLVQRLAPAPVIVENDANCAALAESVSGEAVGVDVVVIVTLGTGIGGGIVRQGRVDLGGTGFAGEFGHMVVDPSGPPCPCGQRGCWERFASGGGLGRLAREAALAGRLASVVEIAGGDPELVRGEQVMEAARRGDRGALAVIDQLCWWIGLGLANLAAVLDPQRFVLGGGVADEGDLIIEPTRSAFADLVEGGDSRPEIPIVVARWGARAGAIGAALAATRGGLP